MSGFQRRTNREGSRKKCARLQRGWGREVQLELEGLGLRSCATPSSSRAEKRILGGVSVQQVVRSTSTIGRRSAEVSDPRFESSLPSFATKREVLSCVLFDCRVPFFTQELLDRLTSDSTAQSYESLKRGGPHKGLLVKQHALQVIHVPTPSTLRKPEARSASYQSTFAD